MTLKEELDELREIVTVLSTSMAELLTMVKEAESKGFFPPGSLDRASRIVELGKLRDDLATVREVFDDLLQLDTPSLQERLKARIDRLVAQIDQLTGELNASSH